MFFGINFVFVQQKNFNIDEQDSIISYSIFSTILVRYLLNTRYDNRRFEMISDEVSRAGGT